MYDIVIHSYLDRTSAATEITFVFTTVTVQFCRFNYLFPLIIMSESFRSYF